MPLPDGNIVMIDCPRTLASELERYSPVDAATLSVSESSLIPTGLAVDVLVVPQRLTDGTPGTRLLRRLATVHSDAFRVLLGGQDDSAQLFQALNENSVDACLALPLHEATARSVLLRGLATAVVRRHARQRIAVLEAALSECSTRQGDSRLMLTRHRELVRLETQGAIGHLARGLAHELNNPLATILGWTQRLQRKISDPELRSKLTMIETEVERSRTLVERLRGLAAPLDEERSVCAPAELLRTAANHLRDEGLARIVVEPTSDLPSIYAAPRSFVRIGEQLLLNAAQAGAQRVWLYAELDQGRVVLHLDNDGATPTNEELSGATRPFFTTRSATGGRGLGLAWCAGVLREQEGTLLLDRRPDGPGARVIITLPAAGSTGSGRYRIHDPVQAVAQVLVIDDEPLIAELLADCLTEAGCSVRTVNSAAAAREVLGRQRLRAVIADLHLSDGSGYDVLREALAAQPHLVGHLALVSGDRQSHTSANGYPLLAKPFRLEDMATFISRLL